MKSKKKSGGKKERNLKNHVTGMVIAANTKRNGIKIIIERKCKIKSNICYLFDSISDFKILITSIVKIHYILLTLTKKSKVKIENKKDNNTTINES